ncbi:MAG: bifunctional oligoribonuclease/PAP phosphatase NrnA [Thermogemmata sp.]|uniref:Bifunctional oligoribonuclease/PAP phosphatase NrnA n=1 Tax=Thermogemmata fonticola TaxID=2755323 RepID=A0A7V9ABS4_9BACT|nr:bifunctional oligoribonuclease/PAP phosphatase NrnA [Thermogemmata fonticola]MBA2226383.1 bifunctional oligoribonuclease/PAP phosphatase NrnA [Thermogemmata fonticola]MCX8139225.1 bifunctional oligoribonuclease/PAP phosphatase NrnA [Gemmataceae bacterium]
MPVDWSGLVTLLRQRDRPLLMTHVRPDADGLGSQLALYEMLQVMGKHPRVAIASRLPPRYAFLDPERRIIEDFKSADWQDRDCVLILDTGTWAQLGDFADWLRRSTLPRVVIDHHRTQDDLGGLACVDVTAEATGRLVYELIQALGLPLRPGAAQNLFMALATDTGWFRHANTTPNTFTLAATLMQAGAQPTILYEKLYETATLARLRLVGLALERLHIALGGKVAYTEIYLKDYPLTGAVPGDTEELINYPRSLEGVEVALVFIEQASGGTKVSFRSRSVDISRLAERFGGGGHPLACGATLPLPLHQARETVLAALQEWLRPSPSPDAASPLLTSPQEPPHH